MGTHDWLPHTCWSKWLQIALMWRISCLLSSEQNKEYKGLKRNEHVYTRLSSELAKHGVEKTGKQCRNKVKKLQEYKKIKDNHNQMGTGRTKWKFYERINEILTRNLPSSDSRHADR